MYSEGIPEKVGIKHIVKAFPFPPRDKRDIRTEFVVNIMWHVILEEGRTFDICNIMMILST